MTFRIGIDLTRMLLVAASLGSSWSCSGRGPEPSVAAAPAAGASDPGGTAGTGHPVQGAPAPAADPGAAPAAPPATETTSADTTTPAPAAPTAAAADTQYLKWDPAAKTVTFRLVAGPFDFSGFTRGGGTLTLPPGTANVWNFLQNDGTPHSAEVGAGSGPIPNSGGDPAIPRAYTNKVVEGLVQGATDVIRFTAPDSGTYRIICGVPGHALSGMWIWFKIDPSAKAPSFGATPQ